MIDSADVTDSVVAGPPNPNEPAIKVDLSAISDDDLVLLRAGLDTEMRKRKIAFSVGGVGERLAIEYFRETPGLPKLQLAPSGTKNVDALSRNGDRYSIKAHCSAKKTGTIYPDPRDRDKQLFEYLLIVKLGTDWTLKSIHQLSWQQFTEIRSWDSRMNAWYVGISNRTLGVATAVCKADAV
jgi:hypothetical protein